MRILTVISIGTAILLAACTSPQDPAAGGDEAVGIPGDTADDEPFAAIGQADVVHIIGTEPFWGGEVSGTTLRWSTPENIDGETITVTRFAGRGGLSFTGTLQGAQFDLAVTPASCSDGMSDRTYPYAVTVLWADQQLSGCGWTDRESYTGGE